MGYRSDVRILMQTKDFNVLDEKLKTAENYLASYDVKQDLVSRDGIPFTYIGWDWIKWYEEDEETMVIDFLRNIENYHFMRIGESYDDFEEDYELTDCDIDCIQYNRGFTDFKNDKNIERIEQEIMTKITEIDEHDDHIALQGKKEGLELALELIDTYKEWYK